MLSNNRLGQRERLPGLLGESLKRFGRIEALVTAPAQHRRARHLRPRFPGGSNLRIEPGDVRLFFRQAQFAFEIHSPIFSPRAEPGGVAGFAGADGDLHAPGAELMAVFQKFERVLEPGFRIALARGSPVEVIGVGADAQTFPPRLFGAKE